MLGSSLSIIFLATYFFKKDYEIRIQESNLKISEIIALTVRSEIRSLNQILSVTAQSLATNPKNLELSRNLLKEKPDLLYLSLMDRAGKESLVVWNSEGSEETGISKSQLSSILERSKQNLRPAFQDSTVLLNSSLGLDIPLLTLGFPFPFDRSQIIVGVIRLESFLAAFQTSGVTESFMVNQDGTVLAHPDIRNIISGSRLTNHPVIQRMNSTSLDNGQLKFQNSEGEYFLASFKRMDIGGAGIVSQVSELKAMEAIYNIQRRNFYLFIAALNISIIFIFFFAKKISEPILQLVLAARKIENGNYHLNLKPQTRDEIGILTNSFQSMSKGLEEREKLKVSFGKFVNDQVAELSMRGLLKVGGEKKNCTILFSDIRDFTSISEKLKPEEVVEFLNEYMSLMVSCVKSTEGYVDKFIGDAIMATWGNLSPTNKSSEMAIRSALLMRQKLKEFNANRGKARKPIIRIGVGINSGPVVSGQIGSDEKMEFTVIGDAVNVSSRLENLTKDYDCDIIVSEPVYLETKSKFKFLSLKSIAIKGKSKAQKVYAVLGEEEDPNAPESLPELKKYLSSKT